jgi:hypothetical protein
MRYIFEIISFYLLGNFDQNIYQQTYLFIV